MRVKPLPDGPRRIDYTNLAQKYRSSQDMLLATQYRNYGFPDCEAGKSNGYCRVSCHECRESTRFEIEQRKVQMMDFLGSGVLVCRWDDCTCMASLQIRLLDK